ncbi:MAG: hypothetical protein QW590_00030 [Candidatus Bilamarchaeaceae archaeon]
MKIKLTPELAYVIGLWRKKRSFEGLGVRGNEKIIEVFSKEVLSQGLTTPERLLTDQKQVYFYHTAYRKFFNEVEEEQLERFKYLNEYAANYLAGLFDAVGNISEDGVVVLSRLTREDELLMWRLGFKTKRKKEVVIVERPTIFLAFIKNYVKVFKGHRVFDLIDKTKKS